MSTTHTHRPGQFVVGSFFGSDNTCEICRAGYQTHCVHALPAAPGGAQAEYARITLADGTLVPTAETPSEDLVPGQGPAAAVTAGGHADRPPRGSTGMHLASTALT